jgi:type IV pilus assembly protein PilE
MPEARRPQRGFTLVECAIVCAVAAILAAVALPSFRSQALRSARIDAVESLLKIQMAQEQYRAQSGLYAGELGALRGVSAQSTQGRYTLGLALTGPDSFVATASARGTQAQDNDCTQITLEVSQGFAHAGPTAACWNR